MIEKEIELEAKRDLACIEKKVCEAQIKLLYQHAWTGLMGVLIVALTAFVIFRPVIVNWQLSLWLGMTILLNLIRGLVSLAFKKRESFSVEIDRWANLHVIGVTTSAFMWAIPSVIFWPSGNFEYQLVWPILILPLSAAAVATYYSWTLSYVSFVVITVLPISFRFFYEGGELLNILGFLSLFFLYVLLRAGKVMNSSSKRTFEFGIRNEALNSDLKEVIFTKVQLNERLQKKVEELILAEKEKEKLINELQVALDEIKTLKGVMPICMHCKGIRDDKGYWNQLEQYLTEHSDAKFSHGICETCMKEHYSDLN